jgi:hypothetical protein
VADIERNRQKITSEVVVIFTRNIQRREGYSEFIGRLEPTFPQNQRYKDGGMNKRVLLPSLDFEDFIRPRQFQPLRCIVSEEERFFMIKEFIQDEKPSMEKPKTENELYQLLSWMQKSIERFDVGLSNLVEYVLTNEGQEKDNTAVFIDWQNIYNYFKTLWGEETAKDSTPEMIKRLLYAILNLSSNSKRKRTISLVSLFGYRNEFPDAMMRPNWSGYHTEFIISPSYEENNTTDTKMHERIVDAIYGESVDTVVIVTGDRFAISSVEAAKARDKFTIVIGPTEQCNALLARTPHLYLDLKEMLNITNEPLRFPGILKKEKKEEKAAEAGQ